MTIYGIFDALGFEQNGRILTLCRRQFLMHFYDTYILYFNSIAPRFLGIYLWHKVTTGSSNGLAPSRIISADKRDRRTRSILARYLRNFWNLSHYNDVIISAMASQITGVSIACSAVGSGTDQRKHQSSASLAFVRGSHRWPVNSPHKAPVTRKMLPFDDVILHNCRHAVRSYDISGMIEESQMK